MSATLASKRQIKRRRAYLEHTLQRHLDAAEALIWELDRLDGDPDLEPFLSATGGTFTAPFADQRRWAAGSTDGREEQCEDEGAGDEREPDPSGVTPTYHPEDQRRVVTGRFGTRVFYTEA